MKNNLIKDIKTSVGVYGKLRKARKEGREPEIKTSVSIPVFMTGPGFLDTVEGHSIAACSWDLYMIVKDVFDQLTYESKRKLLSLPCDGEYMERVLMWKSLLDPTLPSGQYHKVMGLILNRYVFLKHMEV